jgi:hypothetical protein
MAAGVASDNAVCSTAVTIENAVFWDGRLCGSYKNLLRTINRNNFVPTWPILVFYYIHTLYLLQEHHAGENNHHRLRSNSQYVNEAIKTVAKTQHRQYIILYVINSISI